MNPVGFGRHAEVLIHTPLPPHLTAALSTGTSSLQQQQTPATDCSQSTLSASASNTTEKQRASKLSSLFSALKPSHWKSSGDAKHNEGSSDVNSNDDHAKSNFADKKHHQSAPVGTSTPSSTTAHQHRNLPPVTLGQLQATALTDINNTAASNKACASNKGLDDAHLLSFDILRYAVFAATETVNLNRSVVTAGVGHHTVPAQAARPKFVFKPEVLSEIGAKTIMESHLHNQVYYRLMNITDAANTKLVSSSAAAKTKIGIGQTQMKTVIDMSDISGKVASSSSMKIDPQNDPSHLTPFHSSHQHSGNDESGSFANNSGDTMMGTTYAPTSSGSEVVIRMTAGSPSSPNIVNEKLLALQKVTVSQWQRTEAQSGDDGSSASHDLIRLSAGPENCVLQNHIAASAAQLSAYDEAICANDNHPPSTTLPRDKYNVNVPYTVHFYGAGVGDANSKNDHSRQCGGSPVVVAAPSAGALLSTSESPLPIPTVTSLGDLPRVHAPPIVVKLFREHQEPIATATTHSAVRTTASVLPVNVGNTYDNEEDGFEGFNVSTIGNPGLPFVDEADSFGGGSQLLLHQWDAVERTILEAGLGGSSRDTFISSVSPGIRRRPGWVDEIVQSMTKEIEAKNMAHRANKTNTVTRINFLCFVPYVVCHPTTTRKMNILYAPALNAAIHTHGSSGNNTVAAAPQLTSEELRNLENGQNSVGSSLNVTTTGNDAPDRHPHPTLPKALIIPVTASNSTKKVTSSSAIPLPIATLDGVVKDTGYIVSIVPKYGS